MEALRVLVKVGDTALTVLRNCQAIRAVTIDELEYYIKNSEIDAVIIEQIHDEEIDRTADLLSAYQSKSKAHKIYFHTPDKDSPAVGLADILSKDIQFKTSDIWELIESDFQVYTGTSIEKIAASESQNYKSDIVTNPFDINDDINSLFMGQADASDEIQLPSIINKDSIDIFGKHKRNRGANTIVDAGAETPGAQTETNQAKTDVTSTVLLSQMHTAEINLGNIKEQLSQAKERIAYSDKIIKALQDEKDTVSSKLETLLQTKLIIEESVPASDYQSLILKYDELQSKLKLLSTSDATATNPQSTLIAQYDTKISYLTTELSTSKQEIARLREKVECGADGAGGEPGSTVASSTELLKLEQLYSQAQSELTEIREKNSEYTTSLLEYKDSISLLNGQIGQMQVQQDLLTTSNDFKSELLTNSIQALETLTDSLNKKGIEIQGLGVQLENSANELSALELSNQEKDTQLANNQYTIQGLEEQISELQVLVSNVQTQIDSATSELSLENSLLKSEKVTLQTTTKQLENQLGMRTNQLAQLRSQFGAVDSSGIPLIISNAKAMEMANRSLKDQLLALQQRERTITISEGDLRTDRDRLKLENDSLRTSMAIIGSSSGQIGSGIALSPITYTAKAKIINVIGCGSYGITTTAISLAQRLSSQSSVLIIDLDLASPKIDAYYSASPFIANLPEFRGNTTALTAFFNLGFQYLLQRAQALILPRINNKQGRLMWLPGCYEEIDETRLLTADYSSLLNSLGQSFEYIIIDTGKMGTDRLTNKLTENLSQIAYRNILVCSQDYFDIRATRHSTLGKIRTDNLVWMLNQCSSTQLADKTRKLLVPDAYDLIPTGKISGSRKNFYADEFTKAKFDAFIARFILANTGSNRGALI